MKVQTSVISAHGFKCWVQCAAWGKEGPAAEGGDRRLTRERARRAALDAHDGHGSLWWEKGGEVFCIRCVVERLPEAMKKRNPGLCRRVGVPVPGEEQPAPPAAASGPKKEGKKCGRAAQGAAAPGGE